MGDQMADALLALPDAPDAEQAGAQQLGAESLADLFPDDDLGRAVLVLQADEDHALGGLRLLAAGDDAGAARQAAVGQGLQLRRRKLRQPKRWSTILICK